MYGREERYRNTPEYEADNPGGYDPYGSPRQPQQRSDDEDRQMGAGRRQSPSSRAPRPPRPGGYQDGYPPAPQRSGGRWTEDDVARYDYDEAHRYHGPGVARGGRGIAGSGRPTPYGAVPDWDYGGRRYDEDRGLIDRAGDEIASWFGDEQAERRREMDHRGRGPSGYTRSDERIREDACDRLTDDWALDPSDLSVTVKSGEVAIDGHVADRQSKRRAEDCVDRVSGVKHVQNNLRIKPRSEISVGTATRSGGDTEG